ncbi:Hypothetical_protein [Hexamita inflata]|uniref:Hypothetical_protein n=1 Tax=Hexamita inflata TaxID=28002 RepID=A0ABP1GWP2_9EUKA
MVEVDFENFVNYLRSGNTDKLNIISFQQNQQHKINLSTQLIFDRILTKTVVQLNSVKLEKEMYILQKSNAQLFLYTDNLQKSAIFTQVYNYAVNIFVLFGLSEQQVISDSQINISLKFEVFQGALICLKCEVQIFNCTLVFIAAGNQISGILIETCSQILIQQTFIQYRTQSLHSSGIVNLVNSSDVNISIIDCKLTGFDLINSGYSGYIATQILQNIIMKISQFQACIENMTAIGNQSIAVITYSGTIYHLCDLCDTNYFVYGLCSDTLKYGQELNRVLKCVYPFEYVNNQCVCGQGYVLDQLSCLNIIQIINNAMNQSVNSELVENFAILVTKLGLIVYHKM